MPGQHKLLIYSRTGTPKGALYYDNDQTGFLVLGYNRVVNGQGIGFFTARADQALIQSLDHDDIVVVWSKDAVAGISWTQGFVGFVRKIRRQGVNPGITSVWLVEDMFLLASRRIMFPAGMEGFSKFTNTAAETISKDLVNYNLGPAALAANDRIMDGADARVTIEADAAGGNNKTWYCFQQILLESLADLSASGGGGDFYLDMTSPGAWVFRWVADQLGEDRTSTVRFSVELDNMTNPTFESDRLNEKTIVAVGGQDVGENRSFEVVQKTGYVSTDHVETFTNASDVEDDGLAIRGQAILDRDSRVEGFWFDAAQTAAFLFGRDYFLGDLASAKNPFTGLLTTVKVMEVHVSIARGEADQIRPILQEVV